MIRYSKSSEALLQVKRSFFDDNDAFVRERAKIAKIYAEQPKRDRCKICDGPNKGDRFTKTGIEYIVCDRCGHLNGAHEDTTTFNNAVYTGEGGTEYAKIYSTAGREAYAARVRDIYRPKADFLFDVLAEQGEEPEALSYMDIGAGSGYFVQALRDAGAANAQGFEVSETQAALANEMVAPDAVLLHGIDDVDDIVGNASADVITLVGVLEHVQRPRNILARISENPNVRYVFILIPLYSISVFLEMVFPAVMHRVLSGGHTHLFTESSVDWLCREFGQEKIGEWWFGTDIVDLFRSVLVSLEQNQNTAEMSDSWRIAFTPVIDEMQAVLDRHHLCSEYHFVTRRVR